MQTSPLRRGAALTNLTVMEKDLAKEKVIGSPTTSIETGTKARVGAKAKAKMEAKMEAKAKAKAKMEAKAKAGKTTLAKDTVEAKEIATLEAPKGAKINNKGANTWAGVPR